MSSRWFGGWFERDRVDACHGIMPSRWYDSVKDMYLTKVDGKQEWTAVAYCTFACIRSTEEM
jgi:hypothetical protein